MNSSWLVEGSTYRGKLAPIRRVSPLIRMNKRVRLRAAGTQFRTVFVGDKMNFLALVSLKVGIVFEKCLTVLVSDSLCVSNADGIWVPTESGSYEFNIKCSWSDTRQRAAPHCRARRQGEGPCQEISKAQRPRSHVRRRALPILPTKKLIPIQIN